jgi:GNAT superfamily N-acetyltransferase
MRSDYNYVTGRAAGLRARGFPVAGGDGNGRTAATRSGGFSTGACSAHSRLPATYRNYPAPWLWLLAGTAAGSTELTCRATTSFRNTEGILLLLQAAAGKNFTLTGLGRRDLLEHHSGTGRYGAQQQQSADEPRAVTSFAANFELFIQNVITADPPHRGAGFGTALFQYSLRMFGSERAARLLWSSAMGLT